MSPPVRYSIAGGVATITVDRPDSMNSLDTAAKDGLLSAVVSAGADESVRCVVLTGSGRAFCVGQDLGEHIELLSSHTLAEVWSTVDEHYSPIATGIAEMAKPVIAAVNGVAAGAGLSIAMACDLRIAADSAGFNTAFAGVALSCDTGSSWTLPRLVGATKAMELLLLPRTIDAQEALRLGLVTRVVPAGDLAADVAALADSLARGPTLAYSALKRSVAFGASHSLAESLAFEAAMMALTGGSDDHRNAVHCFVAKQKPTFEGH